MVRRDSPVTRARRNVGLTQAALAGLLEMGERTLRRHETRPESMSVGTLLTLAAVVGVSPHDLLDQCIRYLEIRRGLESQTGGKRPSCWELAASAARPRHSSEAPPCRRSAGEYGDGADGHRARQPGGDSRSTRPAWTVRRDDRFWAELKSRLLRSVPHGLGARDAAGVVQDTLLRIGSKPDPCGEVDPCQQGKARECSAKCRILWLGRKILRDVAADRLRRLGKERRSLADPEEVAPVALAVDEQAVVRLPEIYGLGGQEYPHGS